MSFERCFCSHVVGAHMENLFHRILRFKGGWAGQCSHRLEVFEMGSHFEF